MVETFSGPSKSKIYDNIGREIPFLPIEDLTNAAYGKRNLNSSCAWYPTFHKVRIHNDYWQEYHNGNVTNFIFGAYLDRRPTITGGKHVVRVLTMMNFMPQHSNEYPASYCQLWYDEQSQPEIVPVTNIRPIWLYAWGHGSGNNYAHLLTCIIPQNYYKWVPKSVSLVASPCHQATNNVRVIYQPLGEHEEKKGFAVCVKGLDYPYGDMSHRIVEFMETLRALGAEKVTMYKLQVHPNTTKVLNYYERTGFLEYLPFSLSLEGANSPDYRHLQIAQNAYGYILHEVVPYNDCLYRNMYRYQHVAVIDIDELPTPVGNFSNWHDLMEYGQHIHTQNCQRFASFCFRCVYFPKYPEKPTYSSDIPEYFYMMRHVYRVREHIRPEWATKCLHNTDWVIATHNHFPMHYSWDVCPSYSFDAADAQLQHYREPLIRKTLNDPVVDTNMWRYKDEVIARSLKVFEELNFFEKEVSARGKF